MSGSGQEYPWPGDWDPARANSIEAGIGRTVAVGLYPDGTSLFGFDDMSGNVLEWCLNEIANPGKASADLERPPVLRGGSWNNSARFLRAFIRHQYDADNRNYMIGFRVCRAAPTESGITLAPSM